MSFKYQLYPTLLDSFRYWRDNEEDELAFNDLINKLNGEKREQTEENLKGIAFESLINEMIDWSNPHPKIVNGMYSYDGFDFSETIVDKVYNKLRRCKEIQSKIECIVSTKFGNVRLHGIYDYLFPQMIADLKTTSKYGMRTENNEKVKKYASHFQHKFASLATDKLEFNYVITDFKYFYIENFKLGNELNQLTILEIEEFIEFLEMFKYKFKTSKVFVS